MASTEQEMQRVFTASRTLQQRWAAVREGWRDDGATAFERDSIVPLERDGVTSARLLERLQAVLANAERFTP
jgi:hypothetical protein